MSFLRLPRLHPAGLSNTNRKQVSSLGWRLCEVIAHVEWRLHELVGLQSPLMTCYCCLEAFFALVWELLLEGRAPLWCWAVATFLWTLASGLSARFCTTASVRQWKCGVCHCGLLKLGESGEVVAGLLIVLLSKYHPCLITAFGGRASFDISVASCAKYKVCCFSVPVPCFCRWLCGCWWALVLCTLSFCSSLASLPPDF